MKINTKQLKGMLSNLQPGLSSSGDTTDQSSCFVFAGGKAHTYNDEVAVTAELDIGVEEGAVSAKELVSLVGKLKGEETEITWQDHEIRLTCGKARAGIKISSEIHMPLDEISLPTNKQWKPLTKEFRKGLKSCLFSASRDMSKEIITVVYCSGDSLRSTDNERATIYWIGDKCFKTPVLIPAEAGKLLVSYSDIRAYSDHQEGWLHFDVADGVVFSCRCLMLKKGQSYPEFSSHFEVKGNSFSFPTDTKNLLDRAGVFIDVDFDQDKKVLISITGKGVMKIRAEGETGWFEETARIKGYSGKEASFSINPQYLQQILSSVESATIGDDRVLFKAEGFEHIVSIEV